MLRTLSDLQDYSIGATDGTIGHVTDFYFDDHAWVIRYLVVETGAWLSSRSVLISPIAIGTPNWAGKILPVSITKDQVKDSPDIDTDQPVSRQHEMRYLGYYGYPYYWGGRGLWGRDAHPGLLRSSLGYGGTDAAYRRARAEDARADAQADAQRHEHDDHHLRSCKAVMAYHIQATDGEIGHVQSLLVDEDTWAIRYLIVKTSNWWLGHDVLIAPPWIAGVSWTDGKVSVSLTRDAVRRAPPYTSGTSMNREDEIDVHEHYGRRGYWAGEVKLENPQFHIMPSGSPGAIGKTLDGAAQGKRHDL